MEVTNPITPDDTKNKPEESNFNLKWLVSTVLAIWPWLLGSIIISLIAGNLYLRYATPIYKSYGELLIIDSKKGSSTSGDDIASMLKMDTKINIDNEIEIMKSRSTMTKVVKRLALNVNYSVTGRFKVTQLYTNRPFDFIIADSVDDYFDGKVEVIDSATYKLTTSNGIAINGRWNDTIKIPGYGRVVLKKTPSFSPAHFVCAIDVTPVLDAANNYMYNIEVSPPAKSASYITISMQDNIPERSVDIINTLMQVYMDANVENRNRISISTINFINERANALFQELNGVETEIETFQQKNNLADMSAQAEQLVNANSETINKLAEAEVDLYVITSISDKLANAKEDEQLVLPSNLLDNAAVASQVNQLSTLETEIESSLISNTPNNLVTKNLLNQKKKVKENIIASLASSKKALEIKVQKIKDEMRSIQGDISKVPSIQKKYLDYARVQSIKQELYIFLLKKREETEIQKASTVADASIVDGAITVGQVLPNHPKVLMLSLLIGAILRSSARAISPSSLPYL